MSSGYGELIWIMTVIFVLYSMCGVFSISTVWYHHDCYVNIGWTLVVTYAIPVPLIFYWFCCACNRSFCYKFDECLSYLGVLSICAAYVTSFTKIIQVQIHSPKCMPIWILIGDWLAASLGIVVGLMILITVICMIVGEWYSRMKYRKIEKKYLKLMYSLYDKKTDINQYKNDWKIKNKIINTIYSPKEIKLFMNIFEKTRRRESDVQEVREVQIGLLDEKDYLDDCGFCGKSIDYGEKFVITPECCHTYHSECFSNYLMHFNNLCAICGNRIRHSAFKVIHGLEENFI